MLQVIEHGVCQCRFEKFQQWPTASPGLTVYFMNLTFTAVFRQFPEGYSAFVEELPGAHTQGVTLEEARTNLVEAVEMVLEANRQLAEEEPRQ